MPVIHYQRMTVDFHGRYSHPVACELDLDKCSLHDLYGHGLLNHPVAVDWWRGLPECLEVVRYDGIVTGITPVIRANDVGRLCYPISDAGPQNDQSWYWYNWGIRSCSDPKWARIFGVKFEPDFTLADFDPVSEMELPPSYTHLVGALPAIEPPPDGACEEREAVAVLDELLSVVLA